MIAVTTPDNITHFLDSPEAIALIPSANTRAALQAAYDAGNWESYTPPEPPTEPEPPNWPAFRMALLQDASFRTWSEGLPDTWREDLKMSAIAANPEALQGVYDYCESISEPSSEAAAAWQQIAQQNGIPVMFDA